MTTVYLAGKVAKNDWRHEAVPDLRGALYGTEMGPQMPEGEFFVLDTSVHYSGPFFVGCDHGCAHGPSTHGTGVGVGPKGAGCIQTATTRSDVVRRCREGIDRADHVFAWLDDLTAYGTLFEIGLAVGLGKKTWLYTNVDRDHDDLWFAKHSATDGAITYADSASIAVKDFISKIA